VRAKKLTPPLPLPYRGGEQTTNVIKYQNKSHATIPRPCRGGDRGGVSYIKKKREEDKEIEEVVWEKH
jgi:hypothetical protein